MTDVYYHEYNLSVTSEHSIPPDVLVEHLAVALRSLNFTGKIGITMNSATVHGSGKATWDHPFDGPEVFDDMPKPVKFSEGGYTGTHGEGHFTPAGIVHEGDYRFPKDMSEKDRELLKSLFGTNVGPIIPKAHVEAAGLLSAMGVVDPYPLATEAAMQLKEARREHES